MKAWTSRELVRLIVSKHDGQVVRQTGSHLILRVTDPAGGEQTTTVPMHAGRSLDRGLLAAIERDLAPALGQRWLRNPRSQRRTGS